MTDKALALLHELENEYGSLDQVLDNDERLKELRNELDGANKIRYKSHDQIMQEIIPLRNKGLSYKEIARKLGFSSGKIRMIMNEKGMATLPTYIYSVTGEDGTVRYCSTLRQIGEITGAKQHKLRGLVDRNGYFRGYKCEPIDPITVGVPPEVLVFSKGKWIAKGRL